MVSIFNETSFSEKKEFNNNKTMTGITDADYRHNDLYVQKDTIILSDVFESLQKKCIELYELDWAYFLSALRLA